VEIEVVARAESERGELVVRRRTGTHDDTRTPIATDTPTPSTSAEHHDAHADQPILELRVNGVFVMDTEQTTAERLLARATLERVEHPRRVLVGGLGLGCTVRELLTDTRVQQIRVAEIEPAVVTWMRDGVLPGADVLADPRVEVVVDDVRDVVRRQPAGSHDVVLLDVDNGPDFLVHDANAALYAPPFLHECRRLLADGGALAVWSSTRSPALQAAMTQAFGGCEAAPVAVDLQGRDERYWLFTSRMVR
jgi:spermidine synthase